MRTTATELVTFALRNKAARTTGLEPVVAPQRISTRAASSKALASPPRPPRLTVLAFCLAYCVEPIRRWGRSSHGGRVCSQRSAEPLRCWSKPLAETMRRRYRGPRPLRFVITVSLPNTGAWRLTTAPSLDCVKPEPRAVHPTYRTPATAANPSSAQSSTKSSRSVSQSSVS